MRILEELLLLLPAEPGEGLLLDDEDADIARAFLLLVLWESICFCFEDALAKERAPCFASFAFASTYAFMSMRTASCMGSDLFIT